MDYNQGREHMLRLTRELPEGQPAFFMVGELRIDYPGYKMNGDYRLSKNGSAPTHTDIVNLLFAKATEDNVHPLIDALEDLYTHGLNSAHALFSQQEKELVYWITLQEEINYPPPASGRKLPFQRYYEAILAKRNLIPLAQVLDNTNNHGRRRPPLLEIGDGYKKPSFYNI